MQANWSNTPHIAPDACSLYHTIARRAAGWLQANLRSVRIPAQGDDHLRMEAMKIVAEFSFSAEILIRAGTALASRELIEIGSQILEHCWQELQAGRSMVELLERHPQYLLIATPYPSFWRSGYRNHQLDALLDELLQVRGYLAFEYTPWQALSLLYTLRMLGRPSPLDRDELFRHTWLAAMPEPWSLSRETAYALTHTVFYMTEFGRDPSGLPDAQRAYLALWVPAWQRYYLAAEDLDLLAEMAIVLRCIHICEDGLDLAGILAAAQRADGSLPGPPLVEQTLNTDPGRSEYLAFLANYHTTQVGMAACLMSIASLTGAD